MRQPQIAQDYVKASERSERIRNIFWVGVVGSLSV